MFSADLGGAAPASTPAATDPPFQKVALLLHGDGTNGAQNNTFVDSSSNAFTITRTGNVAQGTFSPFSLPEGQWSNYFDGSGDYLTAPDNTSLDMGSSSFTVEGWFYVGTVTGTYIPIVTRFNGAAIAASHLQYFVYQSGSSLNMKAYGSTVVTITFSSALTVGNWYHFALVRDGNTISGYLNGIKNATTGTITGALYSGTWLTYIGFYKESTTSYYHTGYTSNIRVVKGTALYNSNFTPSTTPLTAITNTSLLTCQSNRFKDNSSNNFTITPAGDVKVTAFSPFAPSAAYSASTNGGSAYFDGSGDYLSMPISNDFVLGTGDCTIEAWIYTGSTSTQTLYDYRSGFSAEGLSFWVVGNSSASIYAGAYSNGIPLIQGGTVPLNQWAHIAFSRASGTNNLYINGTRVATNTTVWNQTGTATANVIGVNPYMGGINYINGYVSNFRFVKGTAVYSGSSFTVPTAPLTAIANTSLLLNCTNAGIYDNAGKNDIETVGNAQISTSVKKYGTGSMYFDGTGDWLAIQGNSDSFAFGTGDFTIEMWIYFNDVTSVQLIYDQRPLGTQGAYPVLYVQSGTLRFNSNGTDLITTSVATGQWYHIAVSRSGTTTKLFKDGASVGTYGSLITYLNGGAGRPGIGAGGYSTSTYFFNGYIDDLRITKGQALYTSNFTPPTQAFPNV